MNDAIWDRRRAYLLARIERERDAIGDQLAIVAKPIKRVDAVRQGAQGWLGGLALAAVPLAALALRRPARLLRWAGKAWRMYLTYRQVRRTFL